MSSSRIEVTFKRYASLTDRLPAQARTGNLVVLDAPDGAPIAKLIEPHGLPHKRVHLGLVNGMYAALAER